MSINKVIIYDRVSDAGPKLTYTSEGTPQCTITLLVEEPGRDGTPFELFVPIEVCGKQAEPVAEQINTGDVLLVDGKLKWKSWVDKKGEKQGRLGFMA
jgi:single-stranded DNA-binding protein